MKTYSEITVKPWVKFSRPTTEQSIAISFISGRSAVTVDIDIEDVSELVDALILAKSKMLILP